MKTSDLINYIAAAKKKTPVTVYIKKIDDIDFGTAKVFGSEGEIIIGDWQEIKTVLEANKDKILYYEVECKGRNSALALTDIKGINARIEPGAIIRESVEIGDDAVIMMGAVINVGAVIGSKTMIDMGAVLGARASVGNGCHIGAGTVLAGVLEPPSASPVIIEDDVVIGANAVVLEGVRIGKGAVIAAGSVVTENIPENAVAVGSPARVIKFKDERTKEKTQIVDELRRI